MTVIDVSLDAIQARVSREPVAWGRLLKTLVLAGPLALGALWACVVLAFRFARAAMAVGYASTMAATGNPPPDAAGRHKALGR